jgi:hypothetical protein
VTFDQTCPRFISHCNFKKARGTAREPLFFLRYWARRTLRTGQARDQIKTLPNYGLVPVVPVMMMMVIGVIGVEVAMAMVITIVVMVIVTVVMMVVPMAVPRCGWSRAANCDCADNAHHCGDLRHR